MNSKVISVTNIDGRIAPTEESSIPVMDRGFLYGDSVYEVFRTYRGVGLFMDEHFDRLENSARLSHMSITQSRDELRSEIKRTVQATGASLNQDVYVRYQITRGEGPIDLYPDPELSTRYVIISAPLRQWNPEHYSIGMSMAIPKVRRNPVDSLDPNIKGGNYLNNVLAIMQVRKLGADESLILSSDGYVTEASNSNVWFVVNDETITPGDGNLKGLTKAAILNACAERGMKVYERPVHQSALVQATECFVTSATREVMPVHCLALSDSHLLDFPKGGGVRTREIQSIYRQVVDEYVEAHASDTLFAS